MKRSIAFALAAALCVTPVTLSACGGSTSGGNDGGSAATQQDSNPKEQFAGTWKTIYAELDGVVYAGSLADSDMGTNSSYTLNADGTGSMSINGEETDLTWDIVDDEHLSVASEGAEAQVLRYAEEEDALYMDATDDDPDVIVLGRGTDMGVYYGLALDEAEPVESLDDVVGSWTIYGMANSDAMFYGDPDALPNQLEDMESYTLTIEEDGTATLGAATGLEVVEQDGGVVLVQGDKEMPLTMLDDILLLGMNNGTQDVTILYKL